MDKPTDLAFSDYATFRFFRTEIMFFFGITIPVFIAVLVSTEGAAKELALPAAVFSGIGLVLVGIFIVAAWVYRMRERYLINRMFEGEIWECWQFSTKEWESQVESVCNLISPISEGKEAYSGVIASSIIGFVIALILIAVTIFAVDAPEIKIALRIAAAGLFVFMIGVGLFQPMVTKNEALRYRRKALRFSEPRVWFAADGVYHEALGHTSLKELHKVTDQTKSRNRIQFTLIITSPDSDDIVKYPTPVPSGCEDRAGRLVRRYRRERLQA
jgi:hypothetical protein